MNGTILVYLALAIGIKVGWKFTDATTPSLQPSLDERQTSEYISFPLLNPQLAAPNGKAGDESRPQQPTPVRRAVPRLKAAGASGSKNSIQMPYSIWSPNVGHSVNYPRRFGMARHRMAMLHKTKHGRRYGGPRRQWGKESVVNMRMVIKRSSRPERGYGGKVRKEKARRGPPVMISAFHHNPPGSSVRVIGKRWTRVQSGVMPALPAWAFPSKILNVSSSNMVETNDKNLDKNYGRFNQFIQLRQNKGDERLLLTLPENHTNRRSIGLTYQTTSFHAPSLAQKSTEEITKQKTTLSAEIGEDGSIPKRPSLWYLMERKKEGSATSSKPRFLTRMAYEDLFPHSNHPSGSMRPNMGGGHGGHYPEFTSHMTWGKRNGVTYTPILPTAPRTVRKRFHVTRNFFRILNEADKGRSGHPGGSSLQRMVNALSASNPIVSWVALPSTSGSSEQQTTIRVGAGQQQTKKSDGDFHGEQTKQSNSSSSSGILADGTTQGNIGIRN